MGDHAVFFYGTLMVPGILYRVIYGSSNPEPWQRGLTHARPAMLMDHQRRKVKLADYPGIVPCEGACVRGTVCTGLTEGDIIRLDHFEGSEYDRVRVTAKVFKSEVGFTGKVDETRLDEYVEEEVEVDAYVFKESHRRDLEEEEWDFDEFMRDKAKKWTGEHKPDDGQEVDVYFEEMEKAAGETGQPLLEAKVVNRN